MGPTQSIIEFARTQPGGVIRWRDAHEEYVCASPKAKRHLRRGENNHHIWVGEVLRRHFAKVDGVNGYYVLKEFLEPEERD